MALQFPNSEMQFADWKERIEFQINDVGGFENDDIQNASDWSRCAVGERDKELRNLLYPNITLDWVKKKVSEKVIYLGIDFQYAIIFNYKYEALKIYNTIKNIPDNEFYVIKKSEGGN